MRISLPLILPRLYLHIDGRVNNKRVTRVQYVQEPARPGSAPGSYIIVYYICRYVRRRPVIILRSDFNFPPPSRNYTLAHITQSGGDQ